MGVFGSTLTLSDSDGNCAHHEPEDLQQSRTNKSPIVLSSNSISAPPVDSPSIRQPSKTIEASDFKIEKFIASGSYGLVFGATHIPTNKKVAMKFFGYEGTEKPDINWIRREIEEMERLKGIERVIQLWGTFEDTEEGLITDLIRFDPHHRRMRVKKNRSDVYPVIVMDWAVGGEVITRLIDRGKFSERDASKMFQAFIACIHEIHTKAGVINCDLKTENMVFESDDINDLTFKIIDFGMTVPIPSNSNVRKVKDKTKRGTSKFLAPETILEEYEYSPLTDAWQAGNILFILLNAAFPFHDPHNAQQLTPYLKKLIISGKYDTTLPSFYQLSESARDLLQKIFTVESEKRISCEEILQHPWIRDNANVPDKDLGEEFRARLRGWNQRKKLKLILSESIRKSRDRMLAVEQILLKQPSLPDVYKTCMEIKPSERGESSFIDDKSDNFDIGLPSPTISISPEQFRVLQSQYVAVTNTISTLLFQNPLAFRSSPSSPSSLSSLHPIPIQPSKLGLSLSQQDHVEHSFIVPASSATPSIPKTISSNLERSASLTIKAEGIDFDQFCYILREASLPMLATQEVFNIFSESEGGGLVDYLAFLLTLTSFRSDAAQLSSSDSIQQMARLYFDIFDVDGSGTITFDELKNVMGKLLERSDPDLVASNMTPDEIFQIIDKEGDGNIKFAEFLSFFNAVNTSVSAFSFHATQSHTSPSGF